jgi:amino acid transporter
LGVRVFGELEFWFSSIKVISLIGLLMMGLIIDWGGNPRHDRIGFRYWRYPDGPMGHYLLSHVHNTHVAIFLGFWSTLTNALFAYIGTELIGVTVGEAQNPRKNIPIAIRRTFWRILVFYVGGVFVIGLIVPSTNNVGYHDWYGSLLTNDWVACQGLICSEQVKGWRCRFAVRSR